MRVSHLDTVVGLGLDDVFLVRFAQYRDAAGHLREAQLRSNGVPSAVFANLEK